ncbi:MAG TPA: acetyl-CoA hydrolase/transferase C-terminal domain-containing protein [Caulobacteraceae bacterium]|jgi:acyl-CoA hydrolase
MRRIVTGGAKTITADQAAALVKSGMWLDYGMSVNQPDAFDAAVARRVGELTDVKVRNCLSVHPRAVLEADDTGARFQVFSWHFGGYDRRQHDAGLCHYIPLNLGEVPDYYRRFIDPVDIVVIKARPLDDAGWFNLGPTNVWTRAMVERARCVIVETAPGFPHVYGEDNALHVSEVDYVIEGDAAPPAELPHAPASDIDHAVARFVCAEVADGDCLQVGIGGMPNAVCSLLKEAGVKDLGIHTEMLTDGIVELCDAGLVTGARKQLDVGKVTFTFALGGKHLYEAIDRNPDMRSCAVDYTNMPHVIMRNDNVVSINSTTQIDLQGQAASESDGHRHISGTGGQLQFVRGAYASQNGRSFICLPSTYERNGVRKSRVVLDLTAGNIVTTPRSDVMYLVTEYGIANLKGRSVAERARAIIGLAHPDFRESLEREAHEHRLIPRGAPVSKVAAE